MPIDLVRRTYDARARWYNAIVRVLSFGGDSEYRRKAVEALHLRPGMKVLDVGCGTGLNLKLLAERVGPTGLVAATDLSRGMLSQAPRIPGLVRVQSAATQDVFKPGTFDAILCTYVISTLINEGVIDPILRALKPRGRVVISDDSLPPGWFVGPRFMLKTLLKQGWPDLKRDTIRAMKPHFRNLEVTHCHYGMIYIIAGDRKD